MRVYFTMQLIRAPSSNAAFCNNHP